MRFPSSASRIANSNWPWHQPLWQAPCLRDLIGERSQKVREQMRRGERGERRRGGVKRMKDLAGRTAFVTGAGSGIGLGIATALSQAGVKVMLCDIEEEALVKAVEGLKTRTNADVDGVRADVSLKQELQAAADAAVARYGKIHILVNNAGVGGGGGYREWTDAGWNWTLGVNLMSVVWGFEIFGPLIEAHGEGGQIVSTASVAGLISG